MGKRKRPKKKKPQAIILLTPEEETQLTSLIENFKEFNPAEIPRKIPTPELARALVERLPLEAAESIHLITAIKDAFPQKSVQKTIKKTLFKMKQKGISLPDLEPEKGASILVRHEEKDGPSAYLGPIDGNGSRGIFLTIPQFPKGVDVGMGVVNDEEGILQFLFGRYSKKRMKEVKEIFLSNFNSVAEASISHAAIVLEKAYSKNEEGLNEFSRGYLQLRPWLLDNASLLERAAIYNFIQQESTSRENLTFSRISKLLDHELMKTWIIDPEKMKSLMEEIQKAEESPILVSEAQKTEQIEEIKRKAVTDIYPEEKRLLLKWRLEEMAYIFFKLEGEEMARLSLSAAFSMDEKDSLMLVNPFLMAILERNMEFYPALAEKQAKEEGKEEDSTSSIIIP